MNIKLHLFLKIKAVNIALEKAGWKIGLRFDPLIYTKTFTKEYNELFDNIFSKIDPQLVHSVSLGSFRLPKDFFRKLEKLYPDELLLASPLSEKNNIICYPENLRNDMLKFCEEIIKQYVPAEKFFPCHEMM